MKILKCFRSGDLTGFGFYGQLLQVIFRSFDQAFKDVLGPWTSLSCKNQNGREIKEFRGGYIG